MAVQAPLAPQVIPELMAYMATIIQVSQDYVGLPWVRYDAAFRRQAALKGDTKWSAINTTLFTLCCSVPSAKKRCELCLADTHSEGECAQRGDQEPELRDRMKAMEAAVLTMVKLAGGRSDQTPGNREICRKFNSVRGCGFSKYKYWHACSTCKVKGHSITQSPPPTSQRDPQNRVHEPSILEPYRWHKRTNLRMLLMVANDYVAWVEPWRISG